MKNVESYSLEDPVLNYRTPFKLSLELNGRLESIQEQAARNHKTMQPLQDSFFYLFSSKLFTGLRSDPVEALEKNNR